MDSHDQYVAPAPHFCWQGYPILSAACASRNEGGLFGGERTWAWEVKFLDRPKTNYSEGILQGYLPQSRTKVWRSKMIRDHCSPHHKRWPPRIGEYLVWVKQARLLIPPKENTIYVHIPLGPHGPSNGNILSTFSFFTRKLEVTVSGGSTFARVKLKEIDGMAPQDVERAV